MSTILWQDIIFGPIHSRRLGTSLGVNLMPVNGKICNFDCIYCECGWNRDGRTSGTAVPSFREVCDRMEETVSGLHSRGVKLDTITFSGNGEPTIHPDFPRIIDFTLNIRDRFYPEAKVSVLSNSTMVHRPEILAALRKVDNPIMKIDSADPGLLRTLNRPSGDYSLERVKEGLKGFGGDFILQTMFLRKGTEIDCTALRFVLPWQALVLELSPREVMMYTIDRETPESGLEKVSVDDMERIAAPLREAGIRVQVRG